tara:strand:- start:9093 stop:10463 length:1371 start_codon:yes stop_codon:yes gene_type:complete
MSKARELGASLLASKQARDDKFRKRKESWEKRQAWTELLLPPVIDAGTKAIADNALRKDRELFSSDPNAMAIASSFELANRYGGELLKTKEAIDSFGGTPSDYAYNKYSAPFMARAEAELQARNDGSYRAIGEAGPFRAKVDEELRALSDEWATDFEKAYDALQGTGTPEERAARITELSRTINPNKFSDVLFKRAKSFFGKTSREELDAQAMDALINSPLYQNTTQFNSFKKDFDDNKDLFSSYKMSGLADKLGTISEDGMYEEKTDKIKYVGTDNLLVLQDRTIRIHRNTGEEIVDYGPREIITFDDPNDTHEIRTARAIKALPNLMELASDELNRDAYGALMKELGANDNIQNYTNVTTMAEYNEFAKLLETKMSEVTNLKDPAKEALINNFWATAGNRMIEIDALISTLSDDPDEREAAAKRLGISLVEITELQQTLAGFVRGTTSEFGGGN